MGALRIWHVLVLLACVGGVAALVALLVALMRRR